MKNELVKPVVRRRKRKPIYVERHDFLARPGHYARLASATQIVKVKGRTGKVVIVLGGKL